MKITESFMAATLIILWQNAQGQGFRNLDFERATIPPTPVGGATFPADPALAFPGWTVGGSGTVVVYNGLTFGAPAVSLMGPNFPNSAGFTPLQGAYSVLLLYFDIAGGPPTLSQTGVIPSGTKSISFLVDNREKDAVVTLNGLNIPLASISGGRLGGNISALAGSLAQLTFSTTTGNRFGEFLYFDDIQFSPLEVPEPRTLALSTLGILLFALPRRLKPRRSNR